MIDGSTNCWNILPAQNSEIGLPHTNLLTFDTI